MGGHAYNDSFGSSAQVQDYQGQFLGYEFNAVTFSPLHCGLVATYELSDAGKKFVGSSLVGDELDQKLYLGIGDLEAAGEQIRNVLQEEEMQVLGDMFRDNFGRQLEEYQEGIDAIVDTLMPPGVHATLRHCMMG